MGELKVDRIEVSISGADSSYYPTNTKLNTNKAIDAFVGNEFTLSAEIYPENIVNKNVIYSSSNKSVATINKEGDIKIVGIGTCSITCKAVFGGKTISFIINSYEHLKSVIFNPSSKIKTLETPVYSNGISISKYVELEVGETLDVSYTIIPAKHHPNVITKMACGYFDRYGNLKESQTFVEIVGNSIKAKQIGECYLFVSSGENLIDRGNGQYEQGYDSIVVGDYVLVRIISTAVKSISLNKTSLSLQIGSSETLQATVLPVNATNKNVSWTSSDTSVASVDNYGKIITKSIGDTTIQVKTQDGNLTASCSLKVTPILVSSIEFSKQSIELEPNQSITIGYTITPSNATNKNLTWVSSDEAIAIVSQDGKVTAKACGKCNITANAQDKSGIEKSIEVCVSGITLDKTFLEMEIGDEEIITMTITLNNDTNKNVIWTSNDENVAMVDSNGKVTAKGIGKTSILVKTEDGNYSAICMVAVTKFPALIFESDTEFSITSRGGRGGKTWNGVLYYNTSSNSNNWKEWNGEEITSATDNEKYIIYLRGLNNTMMTIYTPSSDDIGFYISGKNISCSGDIRSLLNYKDVENAIMEDYCFAALFENSSIVSAPSLPATTLANYCYCDMFSNCWSLTTPPVLPATILADHCYSRMFSKCRSLTTPPVLPATTLADSCYNMMFSGCHSLKTAPALPAKTLANGCYRGMFEYCGKLTTVPALPAANLADYCYNRMFFDCEALKFSYTKDTKNGYVNEFKLGSYIGDSLTDDSVRCCERMFYGTSGTFSGTASPGHIWWTSNKVVYP